MIGLTSKIIGMHKIEIIKNILFTLSSVITVPQTGFPSTEPFFNPKFIKIAIIEGALDVSRL